MSQIASPREPARRIFTASQETCSEDGGISYDLELDVGGDEIDIVLGPDGAILGAGEEHEEDEEADDDEEDGGEQEDAGAAGPEAAPSDAPGGNVF